MDFRDKVNTITDDAHDLADLAVHADADGACLVTLDQAIVALRRARSAMITQLRVSHSWGDIARETSTPIGTLRRRHSFVLSE